MEKEIFEGISTNLRDGKNVVLLGAPSVGKTYELCQTLIPKLHKQNIEVVFITFDQIEEKNEKEIKNNNGNIINCSLLNQLNENDFLNKIVIIDDFYKVYKKCEEEEILNNLFKILKNEVNAKAICLSTTPYRFEWLYKHSSDEYKEIFEEQDYTVDKKLTYFEISEESAKIKITEKYPKVKDKIKIALKKCEYGHVFDTTILDLDDYNSYAPFALLSCSFDDTSEFLSKLKDIFVKKGYVALLSKILKEISKSDPLKKAFENKIAAFFGDVIFSGICSVPFFTLLSGLGKGKNKNTIPEFFSQLKNVSPTEIEMLEKDGKLEPLTIFYFKELSDTKSQKNLLKLIEEFPEIENILKKHEKELEEIWDKFDEINKKLEQLTKAIESPLLTPDEFKQTQKIKSLLNYKFIGRTDELQKLNEFLDSNEQICSITGDGRVGKTRLVIEFATQIEKKGNWNVYFIHPFNNFNSGLIPDEKNMLLILDDSSRYKDRDKLIYFVLNPLSKEKNIKLLLIDRPVFKKSIEDDLKNQRARFSSLEIGKGSIIEFLKENFPEIDEGTAKKIEKNCKNSFIYAVFYVEYFRKNKKIGDLNDILSDRFEEYIRDICIKTDINTENIKKVVYLFSLIGPIEWNKDKKYLKEVSDDISTDYRFNDLEPILKTAHNKIELLVFSDEKCEIKSDPMAEYIKTEFMNEMKTFKNQVNLLLPYMPRRIAYNLFVAPKFNEEIQDKISGLLGEIWEKLNTSEFKSPEYFEAIIMFTGNFRSFKFFDIEKINVKHWIECYETIRVNYPEKEVREKLASGLVNAIHLWSIKGKYPYEYLLLLYKLRYSLPDDGNKQENIKQIEDLCVEATSKHLNKEYNTNKENMDKFIQKIRFKLEDEIDFFILMDKSISKLSDDASKFIWKLMENYLS